MSTLVIVEHDNQTMHPSTRHVLSAALQLDSEPVFLVIGHHCEAVVNEVAVLEGVHRVLVASQPCYEHQLAENVSAFVVSIADQFTEILAAASTFGKNILPRIAALLDVAQVSDVTNILDRTTFEHPIYAGNALETVHTLDEKRVLSIRPTAFEAIMNAQPKCNIENIGTCFESAKTVFVEHRLSQSIRPDLVSAKIVVSGGRGLQSAEKFKLIEALADELGAAVGASRAAVDAGFVPNDYQVGQTGKVVAPTLYIAIGISGAVQHLAGMKDAKVIVAINKDGDAPIFQIANYGLVGDLFELVPQFIEQVKQRKE